MDNIDRKKLLTRANKNKPLDIQKSVFELGQQYIEKVIKENKNREISDSLSFATNAFVNANSMNNDKSLIYILISDTDLYIIYVLE